MKLQQLTLSRLEDSNSSTVHGKLAAAHLHLALFATIVDQLVARYGIQIFSRVPLKHIPPFHTSTTHP